MIDIEAIKARYEAAKEELTTTLEPVTKSKESINDIPLLLQELDRLQRLTAQPVFREKRERGLG